MRVNSFPRLLKVSPLGRPVSRQEPSGAVRCSGCIVQHAATHLAGVQWMECEEALSRLWEYLDQELGPEEAQTVGEHLSDCFTCQPAYRCDRAFLNLLARQRTSCRAPRSLVLRMRAVYTAEV